jgi:L-lactate dehydrogenase complex protein LldG
MSSRASILQAVKNNQPAATPLPDLTLPDYALKLDTLSKFGEVLASIGGRVIIADAQDDLSLVVRQAFGENAAITSIVNELPFKPLFAEGTGDDPHLLETVDIALVRARFGVAENGAVWVTDTDIQVRVLPFICQHLGVVLSRQSIVPYMHDAYQRIADESYGFGLFIAGPSKTADIEQSLVLGAHGPKTMTVFLTD